jgi:predicted NBD/HSP70 family sugar kinase
VAVPGIVSSRGGSSQVRRANVSRLLRLTNEHGPLSRAELTRLTELSRSTIGGLVADLAARGFVVEAAPEDTGAAGRPSPIVRPSDDIVALAVNPELDSITIGAVGLGGAVRFRMRHEVQDHSAAAAIDLITKLVGAVHARFTTEQVVGVGIAVPGLVQPDSGVVRLAPHLGWHDVHMAETITMRTGLPAYVENDASLGAAAEAMFGAGRGHDTVLYLHGGSSGIGGGVRARGQQLPSAQGYIAELGHTLVNSHGRRCHCSAIGCLETEVRFDALLRAMGLDDLDLREVGAAIASHRSPALDEIIAGQLRMLAVGLRNAVNAFNPSLIVLGGFLSALYESQPETLETALREQLMPPIAEALELSRGTLGVDRLLVGAAQLAFEPMLDDPLEFALPIY